MMAARTSLDPGTARTGRSFLLGDHTFSLSKQKSACGNGSQSLACENPRIIVDWWETSLNGPRLTGEVEVKGRHTCGLHGH